MSARRCSAAATSRIRQRLNANRLDCAACADEGRAFAGGVERDEREGPVARAGCEWLIGHGASSPYLFLAFSVWVASVQDCVDDEMRDALPPKFLGVDFGLRNHRRRQPDDVVDGHPKLVVDR